MQKERRHCPLAAAWTAPAPIGRADKAIRFEGGKCLLDGAFLERGLCDQFGNAWEG
jgi:hypothetical protein